MKRLNSHQIDALSGARPRLRKEQRPPRVGDRTPHFHDLGSLAGDDDLTPYHRKADSLAREEMLEVDGLEFPVSMSRGIWG